MNRPHFGRDERVSSSKINLADLPMRLHDLSLPKKQSKPFKAMHPYFAFTIIGGLFLLNGFPHLSWDNINTWITRGTAIVVGIANGIPTVIKAWGKLMDRRHKNRMNRLAEERERLLNDQIKESV